MQSRGFTLIELLVVISIVGLLSSIILAALNETRDRAREAKKEAELNQLIKAIAFYHDDTGDIPPNRNSRCACWCAIGITADSNGNVCLAELEQGGYVSELPLSPDRRPYYYYDYGSYALVSTRMNPPRFFGNGTKGWRCRPGYPGMVDDFIYCLNYDI